MSKATEWRMVPLIPTQDMRDALRVGSRRDVPSDQLCDVRYAAMLANAPQPPAAEPMTDEMARTGALDEAIATLERRFMGDLNREDMEVKRCIDALVNLRDNA